MCKKPLERVRGIKRYSPKLLSNNASEILLSLKKNFAPTGTHEIQVQFHEIRLHSRDDRNQFQLLESLPGGLEGLRGFISKVIEIDNSIFVFQLQAAGVRVLLPYLPWDDLSPNGQPDYVTLIDQVRDGDC